MLPTGPTTEPPPPPPPPPHHCAGASAEPAHVAEWLQQHRAERDRLEGGKQQDSGAQLPADVQLASQQHDAPAALQHASPAPAASPASAASPAPSSATLGGSPLDMTDAVPELFGEYTGHAVHAPCSS
jgi:hypothetical protein